MTNAGHVGKIAEPARTDVGPSIHRKKQGQISAIPMLSIPVAGTRQLSDGPCSITSGRGTRQMSDGPILDSPFAGTGRMLDIPARIKTAAQYPPFLRPARWNQSSEDTRRGFACAENPRQTRVSAHCPVPAALPGKNEVHQSLHEKIFAVHRHFSKANRRFLSAVLEKILSGITGKLQTTKRHGR